MDERNEGQPDDPLKAALAEYLAIPGMQAALLVSDQGLVISRAAHEGVDTASIAALAIDTVSTVQRFGLQVQAGYLDAMRIEFDKLTVVLAPFAPDVMLALVAAAGVTRCHVWRSDTWSRRGNCGCQDRTCESQEGQARCILTPSDTAFEVAHRAAVSRVGGRGGCQKGCWVKAGSSSTPETARARRLRPLAQHCALRVMV